MIRSLLRLAFFAVICIVTYNYFFGNTTEKDQSQRIFKGVGNVFTEVRELVRSEKTKFDGGKYDVALGKMQGILENLKNHAAATKDPNLQRQVAQLEQRKQALENQVNAVPKDNTGYQKQPDRLKQAADMAHKLESLTNDLQSIVKQVAPDEQ